QEIAAMSPAQVDQAAQEVHRALEGDSTAPAGGLDPAALRERLHLLETVGGLLAHPGAARVGLPLDAPVDTTLRTLADAASGGSGGRAQPAGAAAAPRTQMRRSGQAWTAADSVVRPAAPVA